MTHSLAFEDRGQRVQLSDFMANLLSNPPYCFREEVGGGRLRKGQNYNYKKLIRIINDIHTSRPTLKAPPGFAKDTKTGVITPQQDRDISSPSYFLDLRSYVRLEGGGTRSKKAQGKRQTRKKTARNRR
jgi:hypothetical protein